MSFFKYSLETAAKQSICQKWKITPNLIENNSNKIKVLGEKIFLIKSYFKIIMLEFTNISDDIIKSEEFNSI